MHCFAAAGARQPGRVVPEAVMAMRRRKNMPGAVRGVVARGRFRRAGGEEGRGQGKGEAGRKGSEADHATGSIL
jgi:hypothetical protein